MPSGAWRRFSSALAAAPGAAQRLRVTAPLPSLEEAARRKEKWGAADRLVAAEYRGGHVDRFDRALYAYNDGKWEEARGRFTELIPDSAEYEGERGALFEQILWYQRSRRPA